MNAYLQKPNVLPWPPMIYVATFIVALALQWALPIVRADKLLAGLPKLVGLGIVVVGLALDLAAMWRLHVHETAIMPNSRASSLVTDGVYGLSRNPIYLGNAIVLLGAALGLRWTWLLIALPAACYAVNQLAVEREEQHLSANFGAQWDAYAQRVGRWL